MLVGSAGNEATEPSGTERVGGREGGREGGRKEVEGGGKWLAEKKGLTSKTIKLKHGGGGV